MKYQDLESNPGYQLWLASNAWQRTLRRVLEPTGLTHVQFVLLASIDLLGQVSELVTQADVSRFADTDENMTSQVVRSLAGRGLLARKDHPTDARAHCLALTKMGANVLADARSLIQPARRAFFAPIGEKGSTLAGLLRSVVQGHEESGK